MTLLQTDRLIRIATALGEAAFVVRAFTGAETVSGLFSFELVLASTRDDITFAQLAGKNTTVAIGSADGEQRFFNGIITAFAPGKSPDNEGFSEYRATLQPAAWLLTRSVDCRIFQDKSVPQILQEVLESAAQKGIGSPIAHRMALSGSYDPRPICIQFNETDLGFIERLCAAEGIFFFFEHANGRHTMVFGDRPEAHSPLAGGSQVVSFQSTTGGLADRETLFHLQPENRLTSGKYMARDYNFTIPAVDMTVGCATHHRDPAGTGVIYEYPGDYSQPSGRAEVLAAARIEAEDARRQTFTGSSNCRRFAAGCRFTLKDHPVKAVDNADYVLTRVQHNARQHLTSGSDPDHYDNRFVCLPLALAFRPSRNVPKPMIGGSQVAVVTGPEGEEIHTDKYGRVKVRFFWDRRADQKGDGNMSCWIRVSQAWAGAKYGALYLPRVGQEVIVTFLDNDPDRPIITGRVYNSHNMPPVDLPAEKTRSTLKSSSSKKGQGNFNEIRFEDRTGAEEFFTHAAKDQNEVVQNDMTTEVKHDQRIDVHNNRAVTVIDGKETLTIQSGGRAVSVQADETHTNAADFTHKVSGNFKLRVNGNITLDASGLVTINGAKIILNG